MSSRDDLMNTYKLFVHKMPSIQAESLSDYVQEVPKFQLGTCTLEEEEQQQHTVVR